MANTVNDAGSMVVCEWCRQDGCTPDTEDDCPCPHHDDEHSCRWCPHAKTGEGLG